MWKWQRVIYRSLILAALALLVLAGLGTGQLSTLSRGTINFVASN